MKRAVLTLIVTMVAASGLVINALATPDDTISTTVTPVSIAIDILETGPLAYGNVPLGTTGAVPNPSNFTVQNAGSTLVDLKIAGFNTPGGWNLGASQGADTYVQYYSISGTAGSWTALNLTGDVFKQNLPPTGSNQQSVFVKLDMPTSTNSFNQQTMPIKVTAITP